MIKDFGVCHLSVAPVRAEASDTAEIVTQLLFGDFVQIIEKGQPWIKIYFPADDYEGYMDFKQLIYLDIEEYELGINSPAMVITEGTVQVKGPLGIQNLFFGASIPNLRGDSFNLGQEEYQLLSPIKEYNKSIAETALLYKNTPYLWGGKGIYGIDCSGLTQIVAKVHGIKIPRDASKQVEVGELIAFEDREVGDLVFYINAKGIIHHVGVLVEKDKVIHASGHVRIDINDENGIYREEFDKYTHTYHSIRRL